MPQTCIRNNRTILDPFLRKRNVTSIEKIKTALIPSRSILLFFNPLGRIQPAACHSKLNSTAPHPGALRNHSKAISEDRSFGEIMHGPPKWGTSPSKVGIEPQIRRKSLEHSKKLPTKIPTKAGSSARTRTTGNLLAGVYLPRAMK